MSVTSQLTGLSRGRFHELEIRDSSGAFQDVLSLIAAGGSGAGAVSSAQTPLSISGGVLSIDLSGYTDSAALTTLLSNKLDSITGAGGIVVTGSGTSRTISVDLTSLATVAALLAGLAGKQDVVSLTASRALISNALGGLAASQTTAQELSYLSLCTGNIQAQLNQKQGALSVGAGAFLSGTTLSGYDL